MLKNPDFAKGQENWEPVVTAPGAATTDFTDNKATFTISNVGAKDSDVQLKQEGITLETGCDYIATFKVTSTEARTIKLGFLDPKQGWDWYGGTDIALTANEEEQVECKFTVEAEKKTSNTIIMVVSMGQIQKEVEGEDGTKTTVNVPTPASTITMSDFSLKKVAKQTEDPSEEDPTETLNEEKLTLEDMEKNVTAEDKQDNIYELQVTEKPVSLVAGYKYKISFTAYSENERTIQYGVQRDGSDDENWDTYGDADKTVELKADEETPIELEFVMPKTDEKAIFFINYAQKDVLGNVTFKDMSLKAVAAPDTTKPANMLSGGVKGALTDWKNVEPEKFTVTLGDESGVKDIEDDKFQLQANDMNIVKGKTYKISFKITSDDAR